MPDAPVLMKTQEVADLLRVSRMTVHRWVEQGDLVPVDVPGRNLRFRREDVERLVQPRDSAGAA